MALQTPVLFLSCGKSEEMFNTASPVPTEELFWRGPVTWKLGPCRPAALPPRFHWCVMAPFHFPPPPPSRSPPGHKSQAGALATGAGLRVAEMNGRSCGAGSNRQLEKQTPGGWRSLLRLERRVWTAGKACGTGGSQGGVRVGSLPALPLQALGQV